MIIFPFFIPVTKSIITLPFHSFLLPTMHKPFQKKSKIGCYEHIEPRRGHLKRFKNRGKCL
jgi:hypothetical protein